MPIKDLAEISRRTGIPANVIADEQAYIEDTITRIRGGDESIDMVDLYRRSRSAGYDQEGRELTDRLAPTGLRALRVIRRVLASNSPNATAVEVRAVKDYLGTTIAGARQAVQWSAGRPEPVQPVDSWVCVVRRLLSGLSEQQIRTVLRIVDEGHSAAYYGRSICEGPWPEPPQHWQIDWDQKVWTDGESELPIDRHLVDGLRREAEAADVRARLARLESEVAREEAEAEAARLQAERDRIDAMVAASLQRLAAAREGCPDQPKPADANAEEGP